MVVLYDRNSTRRTPLRSQNTSNGFLRRRNMFGILRLFGTEYAATARTAACFLVWCGQSTFHYPWQCVETLIAFFVTTLQTVTAAAMRSPPPPTFCQDFCIHMAQSFLKWMCAVPVSWIRHRDATGKCSCNSETTNRVFSLTIAFTFPFTSPVNKDEHPISV